MEAALPQDKTSPAQALEAIRALIAEVEEAGWEHDNPDHPLRPELLDKAQKGFALLKRAYIAGNITGGC